MIGVLALDTRFPRIPGDGGRAGSYPGPALVARVEGASIEDAVFNDPARLLGPFVDAGRALVARGATAIVTTCGFLVPLQRPLAAELPVPVGTSSLLLVPTLQAALPRNLRVGIVTIARSALSPAHLAAANVPADAPIETVEGGHFADAILNDRETFDRGVASDEHVEAAKRLVRDHEDVGAIVLECANMPPYASAMAQAAGRPVHSILTLAALLLHGSRPPEH